MARLAEPDRAVLARARAIYLGEEAYHWEDLKPQIGPAADHMVEEIRRAWIADDSTATPSKPQFRGGRQHSSVVRHDRDQVVTGANVTPYGPWTRSTLPGGSSASPRSTTSCSSR